MAIKQIQIISGLLMEVVSILGYVGVIFSLCMLVEVMF